MIKGILDTDILSEISKTVDQMVAHNATVYLGFHSQLTFTSVSVYEVRYGLGAKQATSQMQRFLVGIAAHEEIVPDARDYRVAASMRASMQRAGTPIGSLDPLIAACALKRDMPLITATRAIIAIFATRVSRCDSSTGARPMPSDMKTK